MDYAYQMGEIIAPCDLEGGYFLDIEFNGEIRTIVVVSCLTMIRRANGCGGNNAQSRKFSLCQSP